MSLVDVLGHLLASVGIVVVIWLLHAFSRVVEAFTKAVDVADMNDETFLGYCHLHARTERALFSGVQIKRLYVLAGVEAGAPDVKDTDWLSMPADVADPLIEAARRRRRASAPKLTVLDGGKN